MRRPRACRRTRPAARRRATSRRDRLGVVGDALDRHVERRPSAASRTAKAPRGSPSLGLPTEPQLTNSTPPYSWTHGLWVWPNTSTSSRLGRRRAARTGDAGLSSNRYSLTLRGEPWTRWTVVLADREVQVERQVAHEVLRRLVGVRERPLDRPLAELAVVRRDVRAAAVVEVARDRVVVVAVDRRDRRARRSARRPRWGAGRSRPGRRRSRRCSIPSSSIRASAASSAGRLAWMSVMTATRVASTARHRIH